MDQNAAGESGIAGTAPAVQDRSHEPCAFPHISRCWIGVPVPFRARIDFVTSFPVFDNQPFLAEPGLFIRDQPYL